MAPSIKPFILYSDDSLRAPNPLKVRLVLETLGLPYEVKTVPFSEMKNPEYLAVNPNGRVPSLHDPNKDFTIWESGAIIQYIIDEYDKEHTLGFPAGTKEYYLLNQFLFFQMSGQGPYYGQAYWFQYYHPEKLPSAIERYQKETRRVTGVLDKVLEGKKYLVGEKLTYADLAFVPWQSGVERIDREFNIEKEAPNVSAWWKRLTSVPAVASLLERASKEAR
ncbi:hypothetical protein VTO42DRAFT_8846 [Malbranchea cinnamomea]